MISKLAFNDVLYHIYLYVVSLVFPGKNKYSPRMHLYYLKYPVSLCIPCIPQCIPFCVFRIPTYPCVSLVKAPGFSEIQQTNGYLGLTIPRWLALSKQSVASNCQSAASGKIRELPLKCVRALCSLRLLLFSVSRPTMYSLLYTVFLDVFTLYSLLYSLYYLLFNQCAL